MATVKHIKSRNANYSNAIDYLLFQHNGGNMKPVLDDMGRKLLRTEFYMDGLNCNPLSFDKECEMTNKHFHKNSKKAEIKSHHYIISFDPADATYCGLTGEKAQALSLELAKKIFPGYQVLVVTHTDGNNGSENIHTHIVINSIRKYSVEREEYMSQPHDHEAGFKHRSTNLFLQRLQKEVMEMCEREGLHQIDLLSPASKKITQKEYMVQRRGQEKLDEINEKIEKESLTPTTTVFQTQKQFLRDAIDECAPLANNFEEFQSLLLDNYNISVIETRDRYRYLHPGRDKRITDKSLGAHYGKEYLEQIFKNPKTSDHNINSEKEAATSIDYHSDPIAILYYKSHLRLVIDLQTNVKAMQNQAYARKVKITNLQQMANTIIYVHENGFDTREDLKASLNDTSAKLSESKELISSLSTELKTLNSQIHFAGQYQANKRTYAAFVKSLNKKKFRKEHAAEIAAYEEARAWLKDFYPDGKMISLNSLKKKKTDLQEQLNTVQKQVQSLKNYYKDLEIADANVDEILDISKGEKKRFPENTL